MIVLALCAPKRLKIENPRSTNLKPVVRRRRRRPAPPLCRVGAATTAASVYKVSDISGCLCNLHGLKLGGCAVISRGIVVVEGERSCIRRCLNFMLRKKDQSDSVTVIWQGNVAKRSFVGSVRMEFEPSPIQMKERRRYHVVKTRRWYYDIQAWEENGVSVDPTLQYFGAVLDN